MSTSIQTQFHFFFQCHNLTSGPTFKIMLSFITKSSISKLFDACFIAITTNLIHAIIKRTIEARRARVLLASSTPTSTAAPAQGMTESDTRYPCTFGKNPNESSESDSFENTKGLKIKVGTRCDVMIHSLSKRIISWSRALSEMPRQSQFQATSDLKRAPVYSTDSESENDDDDDYDHCARWNTVYVCSTPDSGDSSWKEINQDYEHGNSNESVSDLPRVIPAEVVQISPSFETTMDWEDDFSKMSISSYQIYDKDFCSISHEAIFEDVSLDDFDLGGRLKDLYENGIINSKDFKEWN
mmetsp:Transcript_19326/g.28952  ORF Transcript_19326/g.28952 Transcript_19326/m.28952 type:complete len:298 (-) Transcript_19326:261-1154(-)